MFVHLNISAYSIPGSDEEYPISKVQKPAIKQLAYLSLTPLPDKPSLSRLKPPRTNTSGQNHSNPKILNWVN